MVIACVCGVRRVAGRGGEESAVIIIAVQIIVKGKYVTVVGNSE